MKMFKKIHTKKPITTLKEYKLIIMQDYYRIHYKYKKIPKTKNAENTKELPKYNKAKYYLLVIKKFTIIRAQSK